MNSPATKPPPPPQPLPAASRLDAYAPSEIARHIAGTGVAKANIRFLPLVTLAILAGAFIGFGAMFFMVVTHGSTLGFGITRLIGGLAFSLGLILVIIGGAELFTGNNLIVMAWCDGMVGTAQILRNWTIVFIGNAVGAIATAYLVSVSGIYAADGGTLASHAVSIATAKTDLSTTEALVRGVLCNTLVCLAVWLSFAAHSVSGKILAIIFPISAFVALGFEHSIANMFILPLAVFLGGQIDAAAALSNLWAVTVGNIVGGSLLVGVVYWIIYRRSPHPDGK